MKPLLHAASELHLPSGCVTLLGLSLLAACGGGQSAPETSMAANQPSTPSISVTAAPSTDAPASAASAAELAASAAPAAATNAIASAPTAASALSTSSAGAKPSAPTGPAAPATNTGSNTAVVATVGGNPSTSISAEPSAVAPAADTATGSNNPQAAGPTAAPLAATLSVPSPGTAVTSPTGPLPLIFNAPQSSAAGDVVNLQGENFGNSPTIKLLGSSGQTVATPPILSTYGGISVTFKVPATAAGALIAQVVNGTQASAPVKLNAARPFHLDAMQIAAKGRFRIFGRSLMVPGSTPVVTVDGLAATIDTKASDEHMLVATAPAALKPNTHAVIQVDNGNGTGPSLLDRNIEAVAGDGGDPFALGVGWGVGFSGISSRVVNAATDPKLSKKVKCDGITNDGPAIQEALLYLRAAGGVLLLPAGTCRIATGVEMQSKVVIQGSGKDVTILRGETSNPVWGKKLDLAGWRDLTFRNTDPKLLNPALQDSTRVFIKNVRFELNGGVQMFLTGNTNFAVSNVDIVQPANAALNGPVQLGLNAGFSFTNNTIQFVHGSPDMPQTHDAYVAGNRISRDVRGAMASTSVVHSLTINFAHRIAIMGNSFDVIGGPVTNKVRNDGETILTEGGGGNRTENLGTVVSATSGTLSDPANKINVNPFNTGKIPENYGVAIVSGKGAGQTRRVTAYAAGALSVDTAWANIPDGTSRYATFVWGLEKAIIKGNTLTQNPRGIWLYQTAVRDVDIVNNTITEGGGIYLRSVQIVKSKHFTPHFGVRVASNVINNSTRQWLSYVNTSFVRADETDFGYAMMGIEIRNNSLQANKPNLVLPQEEAGYAEGYVVKVLFEGDSQARSLAQTRLLGTVLQTNKCTGCEVGVVIGNGTQALVQESNVVSTSTGK